MRRWRSTRASFVRRMVDSGEHAGPVLVIWLDPDGEAEARLGLLHALYHGARIVVLTRPEARSRFVGMAEEVWSEGDVRGPSRFLALMRRISWMSFTHVHDLDGSFLTRFMRLCVWPRPKWHDHRP